jgi:hypothetical protein
MLFAMPFFFAFLFFSWRELVIPVLFGSVVHLQYAELSIRTAKYSQKAFEFYTAVLNFALYITHKPQQLLIPNS